MFLSRNKENNVYPCKSQFYYVKVEFKGVKIIQACFHDGLNIKQKRKLCNIKKHRLNSNVKIYNVSK